MRLAQNELRAKVAARLPPLPLPPMLQPKPTPKTPRRMSLHDQLTQSSLMQLVTMRNMIRKVKNRAKVAAVKPADGKISEFQDQRLERDMDELTPGALKAYDRVNVVADLTRLSCSRGAGLCGDRVQE